MSFRMQLQPPYHSGSCSSFSLLLPNHCAHSCQFSFVFLWLVVDLLQAFVFHLFTLSPFPAETSHFVECVEEEQRVWCVLHIGCLTRVSSLHITWNTMAYVQCMAGLKTKQTCVSSRPPPSKKKS